MPPEAPNAFLGIRRRFSRTAHTSYFDCSDPRTGTFAGVTAFLALCLRSRPETNASPSECYCSVDRFRLMLRG